LALFRQGKRGRYNTKTDPYALTAWCIRVLALARNNPLKNRYGRGSVKQNTLHEIARLSYFEKGPLLAKEYLEKQGIHLIVVHHLSKTYLDGAAMLMPDGTPVIGLTLHHDRIDNFWFCLLHELAHIAAKHLTSSDRIITDDLDLREHEGSAENKLEKEADEMTRDGLIPKKVWEESNLIQGKITVEEVHALADQVKVHPAIIAGRIRFERNNYKLLSKLIGGNQIRRLFPESCLSTSS
jgi:HTH-type transcriptional regulator/antitoxin HigA